MEVFADESGDIGFRLRRGSSPYLVLVLLVFPSDSALGAARKTIDDLRHATGYRGEYHFTSNSNSRRVEFLEAVSRLDFSYKPVVADKRALYAENIRLVEIKKHLLEFMITEVTLAAGLPEQTVLVYDEFRQDREFQREFSAQIRKALSNRGSLCLKEIKHRDSSKDDLVQMVDMLCGAFHRWLVKKDDTFRRIVAGHELPVCWCQSPAQIFPISSQRRGAKK